MRVAVVTHFPDDPAAPVDGVETVSVNLVRALSEFDDVDVDVVTTKQDCPVSRTDRWGKVNVHRLPWAGGSMLRNAVGAGRRQMQEYLRGLAPDIIHAHDTYGLMTKGMGVPRVFTIHGFMYGDLLAQGSLSAYMRSWVWRWFETACWAEQPHIISISPYVRERLKKIASGVIHDIDNPVSESNIDIKRNESKGTVFCAAAVVPRKNQLALVDAVAGLAENGDSVELRLAGPLHAESYVKQVRERISRTGLKGKVHLLGCLNAEQIRLELSSASVFALTSLEENSPMGIEEAMAAGVPVITSNRCGMPYMVRDGESGFLVDPNDPDDIARRLRQLLNDDELRKSMGAKGREIAMDRFHPTKVAMRTREVYRRAMEDYL